MKTVICTTGTSIAAGIPTGEIELKRIRERLRGLERDHPKEFLARASAESNSLHRMAIGPNATIHLLHTETEDGEVCAKALKKLLTDKKLCKTVTLHQVSGLQVTDRDEFRGEGINSLFSVLDELSAKAVKFGDRDIALNITGGFKAVVPYVTLFGLLYRIPVVYIFEHSNALITLPPAAINFDFDRMAQAAEAIDLIAKEGELPRADFFKHIDPRPAHEEEDWFDSLLEEEGDRVTLSAFGHLAYRVISQTSQNISLSSNARAAYKKADGDVLRRFQEMLKKATNPLMRKHKRHSFNGTDLAVFKPGNTSERMAYFVERDEVHVCELYQHDEYVKDLPGKNRDSYPSSSFSRL